MRKNTTCTFNGCEKKAHARGYCVGHDRQIKAGKPLRPLGSYNRAPKDGLCTIEGCGRPYRARGYCATHVARIHRGAEVGGPDLLNSPYESAEDALRRNGWTERLVHADLGPCWERGGSMAKTGYGRVSLACSGKTRRLAHRVAYEHWNGDLADSDFVCHRCDNPPCINPAHLFKGAPVDNSQDSVSKKRHAWGEKSGTHKLTADEVRSIRSASEAPGFSQTATAEIYGVTPSAIGLIVRGKRWAHLD